MRSANEELETMNDELRRHSDEFGAYRQYVDAVLRGLDAGVVVVDLDMKVRSWNRWSENTWGLREEAAIDQVFGALDIGLPVRQLEPALHEAIANGATTEAVLDAVDRRGRVMKCRAKVAPLIYQDRSTKGAVVMLEDCTIAVPLP